MPRSRLLPGPALKIDGQNRKLLAALCADGRASATQLGKQLRMSREVIGYRMRRLEETGVIQGYAAIPGYKKHGFRLYRVFFLLDEKKKQQHDAFLKFVTANPNTVSVVQYSDRWDVGWTLICHVIDEFDRIIEQLMTDHSEVILEIEKFIVITTYASNMLPTGRPPREHHILSKDSRMDATDRRIMHALSLDGRASSYEIGAKVGLSSDAVIARMKRLQQDHILEWHSAIVNLAALGLQWHTYVVQFARLNKRDDAMVRTYVAAHPNILRAQKTFGRWDLMMDLVVENNEQYHAVVKEIKNVFSSIIRKYDSWALHEEHCYTPYPEALLDGHYPAK